MYKEELTLNNVQSLFTLSTGALEYTDCFYTEG